MPVVSVKHREAEILEHVDRCGAGQRVIFNDQHKLLAHSELRTTIDRLRQGPGYGLAIPVCWKGPAVRVTGASTNKLNGGHYPSWRCWPAPAPTSGRSTSFSVSRNSRLARSISRPKAPAASTVFSIAARTSPASTLMLLGR